MSINPETETETNPTDPNFQNHSSYDCVAVDTNGAYAYVNIRRPIFNQVTDFNQVTNLKQEIACGYF